MRPAPPTTRGSATSLTLGRAGMKPMSDALYVLEGVLPYSINVYLLGEVLLDAATRFAARRILRRLLGRTVSLHALTNAHPVHQGASHAICEALGITLWC